MVDVRVLGNIEARADDGSGISVGRERIRAVLAMLALDAPAAVTADEIVENLWADSDTAKPEAALQMSISRLRAALGDDVIETAPGGYRLTLGEAEIDLGRFRALVTRARQMAALGQHIAAVEAYHQALDEWSGGRALSDVRRFDFAERFGRRLEDERHAAVEGLAESQIETGEHTAAITALTGLIETDPYREQPWALLMLALYRSGRHRDALSAFGRVRRVFGDDLGLEPSPALRRLEDRILMHDPTLVAADPLPRETVEADTLRFGAGATIVREGELASTVYWVEQGAVEVVKIDGHGVPNRVAELGPGQYFGELAATLGVRRTATVRAIERSVVTVLDLDGFRARVGQTEPGSPEL